MSPRTRNGSLDRPLRIALVNLRSSGDDWHQIVMVPLGLMYLSAVLREAYGERLRIALFDMTLLEHGVDPLTGFDTFLREQRPDVVGLRGFSSHAEMFPRTARLVKDRDPRTWVVAGGPHASTGSIELHRCPWIDLVCPGEGEATFVELVGRWLDGGAAREVPGVAWYEGGEVRRSEPRPMLQDLDAVPFPDYSILELDRYQHGMTMCGFHPERKFTSVFTSRGCHYKCTYCHDNFGKRVRYRSVGNVIDEFDRLMQDHGVSEFHIVDDIFNADRARAIAIFEEIHRRGWDVRIAFPNGLRGDIMTEDFVAAARQAGVYHWAIAVETATPRIQKLVKKHNRLDKVLEAIELSDRYGVFTCTFNMLGFPGESEEEMHATIDLNLGSRAHMLAIFAVTPHEGTALHDALEDGTALETGGYHRFSDEVSEPGLSEVSRSRIQELIVDGYRRFYFEGDRLERMIELAPTCHRIVNLALHLEERRWAAGYTLETLPGEKTRALMSDLFEGARREEPARSSHLPRRGVVRADEGTGS